MTAKIPPGLFVVGTDTGVGKTVIASAILRALRLEGKRVGAVKPVATGAERIDGVLRSGDVEALAEAVGEGVDRHSVCPIMFEAPMAPSVAARRAGRPLHRRSLEDAFLGVVEAWTRKGVDALVVEGVGGLLCPIAEGMTVADLAILVDYPVLIVARRGLGTLNHSLLTIEAARSRGLRLAGLVLNGSAPAESPEVEASNAEELARHVAGLTILPNLAYGEDPDNWAVARRCGAWYDRCLCPRHVDWSSRPRFASHVDSD